MNKAERSIILPITIGSILEWYEIYLYFYWAPFLSSIFYDISQSFSEFINALFLVLVGFIARPLGGLIFGYIGDKWGRRKSFLLSILFISIPSFFTAFMPDFSVWAFFALIYVGIMKFIQGIPAGGELPGALCFLAESALPGRKRYLCSYMLVGPQIGQILAMVQCLALERMLPEHAVATWGWRLSFFIGGMIGVGGFCLRKKLQESHLFHNLQKKHEVLKNPVRESFKHHKLNIFIGFVVSIFEVAGFFLIAFYLVENAQTTLELGYRSSLIVYVILLTPVVVLMPLFGKLGDYYSNKKLLFWSAIGIIMLSIPFYFSILHAQKGLSIFLLILLILVFCVQFALLPTIIADLYPTPVRFTCVGFSFNICDSVIGGVTPLLAAALIYSTGNFASFVAILPLTAVIFLCVMPFVNWKR